MSIEVERATVPCNACGAHVVELRRGRCWGCYTKWADMRPVPRGAACVACHNRRHDDLRLVEVHGRSLALCHICAAHMLKLSSVPKTIEGLRNALDRERRGHERRGEGLDRRIFPRERRVGDRRRPPRIGATEDTNPAFALPDFGDLEIIIEEADIEEIEQTVVRERPKAPKRK